MGFSLVSMFEAVLLTLNALAILSEKRFLVRYGLASPSVAGEGVTSTPMMFDQTFSGFSPVTPGSAGGSSVLKQQIAQLLSSVRMLLRWPLIFLNAATIVFALILG
jgi:immediate early response 3-interacting protein 1